ncbi:TPA: hypothetical protein ACWS12_000515 [Escherichia coli]|nr:hypothetical protein [Salmonella enterica subsp. enterica serovar Infantis]ECQ9027296.1 hypothetical protein [Salmonella enterica subsp. enterica serovar Enteritidis]
MKKDVETTLVSFLTKFPDFIRQRHDSLEEFNAQLYNEYLTMVEQSLSSLDYLPGILDSIQTLLAANQLTAISLLVGVPDVDIVGTLDKISTKRSPLDAAARTGSRLGAAFAAGESTRLGLPSYDKLIPAVESTRPGRRVARESTENVEDILLNGDKTANMGIGKDALKQINDMDKLSTGKMFSCVFERDGNKAELMLRLRLAVKSAPTAAMRTFIAFSDQTKTFSERWIKAGVGQLGYAKDIFFSNDLIDEYRKNRYRDKTGYYKQLMERRNGNWLSGLLSFSPSINNASAVMIVSRDTLDGLQAELGGDFDDYNVRKRVFEDTLTVYFVVVDTQWNRVVIYTRGMDGAMELDKSDFAKSSKGGSNVNQIIEAYRSGAQPVL